jgi:hypothetical protein
MAKRRTKLLEQVFEARYERGYRYLDRCGDAMAVLEDMLSAEMGKIWMPSEMTPKGAVLKCPEEDMTVSFDTDKLVISQRLIDEPTDMGNVAQLSLAVITGRFDLKQFIRFGARRVHMIPADSIAEAEAMSVSLSPVQNWPISPPSGFLPHDSGILCVYETEDRSVGYRLDIHAGFTIDAPEQVDPRLRQSPHLLPAGQREALINQMHRRKQREQAPLAGVVVDFDYYAVRPVDMAVREFLARADVLEDAMIKGVLEKVKS